MISFSSSTSSASIFFLPPPLHKSALTVHSSFFPRPRPPTPRKNHLRQKLPLKPTIITTTTTTTPTTTHTTTTTITIPPHPAKIQIQPHQILVFKESLVEERAESESARESLVESETLDPSLVPAQIRSPGFLLDLALRFAALTALQTAVIVLYLAPRRGPCPGPSEEGHGEARVGVKVDSILEIRAMAREARKTEAKEAEEAEKDGVKAKIGRGIARVRRSFVKGFLDKEEGAGMGVVRSSVNPNRSNARSLNVPQGFGGSGSRKEDAAVVNTTGINIV